MSAFEGMGRKWRWAALVGTVLVVGIGALAIRRETAPDPSLAAATPLYEVERGPLTIDVSVSGTIKSRDQVILKSEVEGQTTILYLIEEGTEVKEGDLLVELDSSNLQDNLVDQEIQVQNAQASLVNATENLEVTKNQATSDVNQAELALQFAKEDLDNYINGDYPIALKEAETSVRLSEAEKKRAEEELVGSQRLVDKGFITRTEFEADEQQAIKAGMDLELAVQRKRLLEDFTQKRKLTELESDVEQAEMALDRVQRKAKADVVQAEADLRARQLQYDRESGKFEKLQAQIEKTKIYAPTSGVVVYATSGGRRGPMMSEPLDEGQSVRERQELIYLPTTSAFVADVSVHESQLAKLSVGLPVHVTVQAIPGKSFWGRVASIAPMPNAQSMWLNPDLKVYSTDIHLQGDTEGLRTGMGCEGQIIVDEYEDVVYVPVQAVVRIGGEPTVYLAKSDGYEPRTVKLGMDNNRMAHIIEGLEPGDQVLLAPPLGGSDSPSESAETIEVPELEQIPDRPAPINGGAAGARGGGEDNAMRMGAPGAGAPGMGAPGMGAPGAGGGFANMSEEQRAAMRKQFEERMNNMSDEEKAEMQKRMEEFRKNMTPEQRKQMEAFTGGGPGAGGPGGGGPGGSGPEGGRRRGGGGRPNAGGQANGGNAPAGGGS